MKGFVSFIGSGPGDPELLTLKAIKRIKSAEVILFDDLSYGSILDYANKKADLVSVGKRAGFSSPNQNVVSKLLVKYAESKKKIVRLKSGDPGIFGRLEEEIIALIKADVSYEIIPGISSVFATASSLGIPLTRRIKSRRIQFITGHDFNGELPKDINMEAIIDNSATTAVFMGKRTFCKFANKLINHGLSKKTPVIYAEAVSTPNQNIVFTSIEKLFAYLKTNKVNNNLPAIIIFGPLLDLQKIKSTS